jgi:hypothetical protein
MYKANKAERRAWEPNAMSSAPVFGSFALTIERGVSTLAIFPGFLHTYHEFTLSKFISWFLAKKYYYHA